MQCQSPRNALSVGVGPVKVHARVVASDETRDKVAVVVCARAESSSRAERAQSRPARAVPTLATAAVVLGYDADVAGDGFPLPSARPIESVHQTFSD